MYYFIGSLFTKKSLGEIYANSKGSIDQAANVLQWAFIEGFKQNNCVLRIFTLPGVGTFPLHYKKVVVNYESFSHDGIVKDVSLSFCTFPVIGLISRYLSLRRKLLQELNNSDTIIVYSLKSAFLLACKDLKKKYPNLRICVIVPDLPQYMSESRNPIYHFLKKIDSYIIDRTLTIVDSFVVLSDAMADVLNIGHRRWIRIEGIYQEQEIIDIKKQPNFIFAYTGNLDIRYGIVNLLDSFMQLHGTHLRLWICGKGNAEGYLKQCCMKDDRIKYWGQLKHSDVIRLQHEVTVLVNPRMANGEYTKYSFPSKTIEYMASGTPCIMYNLPALPNEYKNHLYLINSDNKDALLKKMIEVIQLPKLELEKKGKLARIFIQNSKSSQVQVLKVINMLK